MRKVGGGLFSRRHHFPPSIFDVPCRWHADGMNIHEFAERACMYHSDFHPSHQAMQIASSRLRMADAALINGTVKMFPLARKIELLFKRERPRDVDPRGLVSSAAH